ncbi:aconitase [Phlyctema vagabunda]|uniref:Aconitase n=1 Tax=Phlyctema vagabunda TaxID=108571 RepID=A0ABR4PCI9_9HELO
MPHLETTMQYHIGPHVNDSRSSLLRCIFESLKSVRKIATEEVNEPSKALSELVFTESENILDVFNVITNFLKTIEKPLEADALTQVLQICRTEKDLGGLELGDAVDLESGQLDEVKFLVEAWLETVNSEQNSRGLQVPISGIVAERKPMNLTEKILAHHATSGPSAGGVNAGDLITITVDWIIASELSWTGMLKTIKDIGEPSLWRNDRFWMAGDHVVEPRIKEQASVQKLQKEMNRAKYKYRMTENKGANYTIMHTEFVRERAQPGMLVIGSDSHTCSAGAVSSLAIGLGAADVAMSLVTGENWIKVPEVVRINFTGEPAWYIGGKDVVLYILRELKRNTAAADRVLEFTGPGIKHLSCDARFAIANMCTELGAITGVFVPDEVTYNYINGRQRKEHRSQGVYFAPDEGASYSSTYELSLSDVVSFVALYPSPDNVVPVTDITGQKLEGCFIGACTTTEEDLILAALVLAAGLNKGLKLAPGKRHVTPGSLPIVKRLRSLGLLDIYERAGYTRGVPGCSYCIGMAADQASVGETWLSSQNRNFKNRMGKGSFGSICSAATVAASSFDMTVTDPAALLSEVDWKLFENLRSEGKPRRKLSESEAISPLQYTEPVVPTPVVKAPSGEPKEEKQISSSGVITSKVITLGDFVDTDQASDTTMAPADFIMQCNNDEDLGSHTMEHTYPEFRSRVRAGQAVVVAGKAFGCGSSREEAPRAFLGLGVKCVIAKTFAFIYGRNQPNIGLLGIIITDDDFYARATDNAEIEVNLAGRTVTVGGKEFKFQLDDMEIKLINNKGLGGAYRLFGKALFGKMCSGDEPSADLPNLSLKAEEHAW